MIQVLKPHLTEEEISAVADTLRSGWWGLGPKTALFEREFARFVGTSHAVGLNSATAALDLALKIVGVAGHEVITPSLTFVSTNHAVLYNGGKPVFADVDAETLTLDPEDIARKITTNTKAIVVVHYAGHPADMDAIHAIARQHNLVVIEDAAHAAGAVYRGRMVGSISPLTCFSFHPVKNIATTDGGMITLNNEETAARLHRLAWLGIDKNTWIRSEGKSYSWQYDVTELGYKCHMNDVAAALGLIQLRRLHETNARRREIATIYDEGLGSIPQLQLPVERKRCVSSWHLYVIRTDQRDGLAACLAEKGIGTGMHYIPNHLYKMYQSENDPLLPVTEREWTKLLSLPIHPGMTDTDALQVVNAIQEFFNGRV